MTRDQGDRMFAVGSTRKTDKGSRPAERVAEPDPSSRTEVEPDLEGAFADDGVDLTLIRWMLRRTPTERLQAAQKLIDATWALRTGSET